MLVSALEELFGALTDAFPANAIELSGEWSTAIRRRYASEAQHGSGEGPFVEVEDVTFAFVVQTTEPIAALVLTENPAGTHWAKTSRPRANPEGTVSFSRYVNDARAMTMGGWFHGAVWMGGPVASGTDPRDHVRPDARSARFGAFCRIAEAEDMRFGLLLLPASALKMGRNGLWRLRDAFAAPLSPMQQQMMTRGRRGSVATQSVPEKKSD